MMKKHADKKRRDIEFVVGAQVLLKMRSHRKTSVVGRNYAKLVARYFGPLETIS